MANRSVSDELLADLDGSTGAAVKARLEEDTNEAISRIGQRKATDFEAEFGRIESEIEKASAIKDKAKRDIRMAVLNAELVELRGRADKEREDLATAVFGLTAFVDEMGKGYEALENPSAEETGMVKTAENKLEEAKGDLASVEGATIVLFRGSKIQAAKKAIADADKNLADTKLKVKQMARNRLMSADMESSLNNFQFKVQKTIEIMEARKKEIDLQVKLVGGRKKEAFRVKELATKKVEELDTLLSQKESELQNEQEVLTGLTSGTEEYVKQETKISELARQVEDIRGNRNNAFVLAQDKERFAIELEVHEKTQIKLRDNQRTWITLLKSGTEERVTTFKSRLEAMKAAADQDVAQAIDKIGTEIDAKNTEYMSELGSASDNLRMKKMESEPERIKRLAEAAAAQAEAQAKIREREKAMIEEFHKRYGINPLSSSLFTYGEEKKNKEEASSDPSGSDLL